VKTPWKYWHGKISFFLATTQRSLLRLWHLGHIRDLQEL
jgi:hypothetical protein